MKSSLRRSKFFVVTFLLSFAISNSVSAKTYTCTVKQEISWTNGKFILHDHKSKTEFTFDVDTGVLQFVGTRPQTLPLTVTQTGQPGNDFVAMLKAQPDTDIREVLRIREWGKVKNPVFLLQTPDNFQSGACR